jgi:hypothetical protein
MFCRLLLVLLAGAPLVARAVDRDEERTFPVQPGCTLKVDFYRGNIDVQESDAAEITVVVHTSLAVASEARADQLQAALGLEIRQEGNTLIVRARDPSGTGVRLVWKDDPPVDLDCRILVPRRCDADLRTRVGAITVGNLTGRIVAHTTKGNLFLRRIDGTIDAAAREGDVIISRCSGAVAAVTGLGTMRVGTLGGHAVLKNSGGDIEVLEAHAGFEATADAGDVTVGLPNDFTGEAKIRTAYGNIFAKIDPAANCVVRASSFWGHVENRLPLAVEAGRDGTRQLAGRLNHGGALVTLHANGGHVFLQKGDTYFN